MESVFFTGAGGQGKTTTAKLIAPVVGLDIVDGLSRNNPYPMGSDEGQDWLGMTVWLKSVHPRPKIHCRTPIDVWAYSKVYGTGNITNQEKYLQSWLAKNPNVVYFPKFFSVENDGFRPTDESLAWQVDQWIQDVLYKYMQKDSDKVLRMARTLPEQRAKVVLSHFLSYN